MDPLAASYSAVNLTIALNALRTFFEKRKARFREDTSTKNELCNETNEDILSSLKVQGLRSSKGKNGATPVVRVGIPRGLFSTIADGNFVALRCEASNSFIQLKEGGWSGKVKDAIKLLIDSKPKKIHDCSLWRV